MSEPTQPLDPQPASGETGAEPSFGDVRERGGCLTMFLVVGVAVSVQLAVMGLGLAPLPEGFSNPDAPSWVLPAQGAFGVLNALLLIGIWFWRRWAVYGFCLLSVIITAVNLATGGAPLVALVKLGAPFVLFLLASQRWTRFR